MSGRYATGTIVGGRYRLQTVSDPGHFGDAFEAVDLQLSSAGVADHRVAIELVNAGDDAVGLGEVLAKPFVRLRAISHPNIARSIDFGIDSGTVFYTSELLDGAPLASILDTHTASSFSEEEILSILSGVFAAIRHVHALGLSHGNLDPGSIFVTINHEAKIADLTAVVLNRMSLKHSGFEAEHASEFDPSSDVFGIASIAYLMLSDDQPYDGYDGGNAARTRVPARRIKGLSNRRWKVLSSALHADPSRRPTLDEFAAEFGVRGTDSLASADSRSGVRPRKVLYSGILLLLVTAIAILAPANLDKVRDTSPPADTSPGSASGIIAIETPAPSEVPPVDAERDSSPTGPVKPDDNPITSGAKQGGDSDQSAESGPAIESGPGTESRPDPEFGMSPDPEPAAGPAIEPLPEREPPSEIGQESETEIEPEPVVDPAGVVGVPAIRFAAESITVTEGRDVVAAIRIERDGPTDSELRLQWWTGENTARADSDFAEMTVREEVFGVGQQTLTLYVPLISDSLMEQTESFFVFVSATIENAPSVHRIEVVIRDNY